MIRPATAADSQSIADIYNYYVRNTVVTFEEEPVTAAEMQQRVADVQPHYPWLVWEEEGKVIGYAYASRWKVRAAYRYAVETSVYLDTAHHGKGIGKQLYTALIDGLRERKMHALIGGVALPNDVSIRLHESMGFKKIGQFLQVGWKLNRWVDVGYWELILEH